MRATLKANPRSPASKGGIRKLRLAGYVPVTVSSRGGETTEWSVPARDLTDILRRAGKSALIELQTDTGNTLVMARDIQREPLSGHLLHVGFRHVSAREPVNAEVRVTLLGEPEAVRTGSAVLEQEASTIEVRGLPDRLPAHIDVDTSGMEIGGVLHVSDIPASSDYEIQTPPDMVIAVVHTVRAAVTPTEEAAPVEETETAAA